MNEAHDSLNVVAGADNAPEIADEAEIQRYKGLFLSWLGNNHIPVPTDELLLAAQGIKRLVDESSDAIALTLGTEVMQKGRPEGRGSSIERSLLGAFRALRALTMDYRGETYEAIAKELKVNTSSVHELIRKGHVLVDRFIIVDWLHLEPERRKRFDVIPEPSPERLTSLRELILTYCTDPNGLRHGEFILAVARRYIYEYVKRHASPGSAISVETPLAHLPLPDELVAFTAEKGFTKFGELVGMYPYNDRSLVLWIEGLGLVRSVLPVLSG